MHGYIIGHEANELILKSLVMSPDLVLIMLDLPFPPRLGCLLLGRILFARHLDLGITGAPLFPGIQVENFGDVRSVSTDRVTRPLTDGSEVHRISEGKDCERGGRRFH